MNPLMQYLKDTRAELRHVAWPTRTQTIVYTVLVAALSVGVALYLGFFDFLFTTGLSRALNALPQPPAVQVQTEPATVPTNTQPTAPTTNTPPANTVPQGALNLVPGTPSTQTTPAPTTKTAPKK